MSNFSASKLRQSKATDNRKVKNHIKSFYKILGELDNVANKIREKEVEVTEDNIEKFAFDEMGREIDSMEKFLLLGKLGNNELQHTK